MNSKAKPQPIQPICPNSACSHQHSLQIMPIISTDKHARCMQTGTTHHHAWQEPAVACFSNNQLRSILSKHLQPLCTAPSTHTPTPFNASFPRPNHSPPTEVRWHCRQRLTLPCPAPAWAGFCAWMWLPSLSNLVCVGPPPPHSPSCC